MTTIPIDIKQKCLAMHSKGSSISEVYSYFISEIPRSNCSEHGFSSMLSRWSKKDYPDESTLNNGTYNDVIGHDATIQVKQNG